jgi:predicted ATPase
VCNIQRAYSYVNYVYICSTVQSKLLDSGDEMIRKWRLENFKSIQYMDYLDLGNITIFAGANSSGKSTIIQSMLMMVQTMANRENVPLQLNGDLVTLGQVADVWHKGCLETEGEAVPLCIDMVLENTEGVPYTAVNVVAIFKAIEGTKVQFIRGEYAFKPLDQETAEYAAIELEGSEYFIKSLSPTLKESVGAGFYVQESIEANIPEAALVNIEDFYPTAVEVITKTIPDTSFWEKFLLDPTSMALNQEGLELRLPADVWGVLRHVAQTLNLDGVESNTLIGRPRRLLSSMSDYRAWFAKLSAEKVNRLRTCIVEELPDSVVNNQEWRSLPLFERVERTLNETFSKRIRYLSANRLPPTMIYSLDANSHWSEVGINGENTASALKEYGQKEIIYWNPQTRSNHNGALLEALDFWLRFFQLVERIEPEDRGKLGTLLRVYASGVQKELDLTSVGFGTSQILPIIVQGLLTPPGSIFIVEQPEVHLHPHVQAQLAHFFFALTKAGVQCIIETHSEHIINQLRVLIAKGDDTLREQVKIYFAARDAEFGTYFEEVKLNAKGAIINWPKGFMDESSKLAQELLLAATEGS